MSNHFFPVQDSSVSLFIAQQNKIVVYQACSLDAADTASHIYVWINI